MNPLSIVEPSHEEIALNAFLLWEKEGRQPGREMNYWLQAETQLLQGRWLQAEASAKAARPWPPTPAQPQIATARAVAARAVTAPAATKPAAKPAAKPATKAARKVRVTTLSKARAR